MFFFKHQTKDIRRIFWAYLISSIGNFSARITLAMIIYELTGSHASLAASFIVTKLPIAIFGNALGKLAQQLNAKKVLIVCDGIGIILFLILAYTYKIIGPLGSCVIFFFSYALTSLFDSAKSKVIVNLSPKQADLNYTVATISEIIYFAIAVGPFVSGYIIKFFDIKTVLFFNSMTFLLSILFLLKIQIKDVSSTIVHAIKTSFHPKHMLGILDNISIIRKNNRLIQMSWVYGIRCLMYGMFNALIPVFGLMHYKVDSAGLGYYFLFSCLGGMLGATLYKRLIGRTLLSQNSSQISYLTYFTIIEAIFITISISTDFYFIFLIFGFLQSIPMLLIECRIDFIFLNDAPVDAKSSIRGFQFSLKSMSFSLGILLSIPLSIYVGEKIISLIIFSILIISMIPMYWMKVKMKQSECN